MAKNKDIIGVRTVALSVILLMPLLVSCSSEQGEVSQAGSTEINKEVSLPDFSSIKTDNIFVYECGDSLQFTAYVTRDSTWLFLPDTTLKVLPVRSGSGAKYEAGSFIYWSKGEEAILQQPRGSFMICKTNPRLKAWEAARVRGVEFRALGQEPGWHVEIVPGKQIAYIGNYGRDTVITPVPHPQKSEDQKRIVYKAATKEHSLELEIIDKPCTDAMSGFSFPLSVKITVDDKTHNGCGQYLH